ncbi:MAG: sodium/calcium exchanger protein [Desulfobacterales bacterium]|nr:sodium/calcium exchanger protein [Desulfobacterales bacterium]
MVGRISVPRDLMALPVPAFLGSAILFYLLTQDRRVSRWEGVLFVLGHSAAARRTGRNRLERASARRPGADPADALARRRGQPTAAYGNPRKRGRAAGPQLIEAERRQRERREAEHARARDPQP